MASRIIGWAILGGAVASVVDIGAATLISHSSPDVIAKTIAGGILGREALKGGATTALLGVLLQILMGALIGAIYAVVRPALRTRSFIAAGLIYGVVVFVVMNYVVLPLSAYHYLPRFNPSSFAENLAAMLCFGLIVACATAYGRRSSPR